MTGPYLAWIAGHRPGSLDARPAVAVKTYTCPLCRLRPGTRCIVYAEVRVCPECIDVLGVPDDVLGEAV